MLTLADHDTAYIEVARRWGEDAKGLPYGTVRRDDGSRHIELSSDGKMALVSTERGQELKRLETYDPDEFLYWIFKNQASSIGWDYEFEHRHPTDDSRRIAFNKSLEEMAKLSLAWRDRMKSEFDAILRQHPFHDGRGW